MILEVTFCALMTGSPYTQCEVAKFPMVKEVTPQQCFLHAQEVIAKETQGLWEGYTAQKYQCVRGKSEEKPE